MDVIDLASVGRIQLDAHKNERRMQSWGWHALIGALASIMVTLIYWHAPVTEPEKQVAWSICQMTYIYFGLMSVLTAWFAIDQLVYRRVLKRAREPYPHALFLPKDVAETKARGKCSCELDDWERHVRKWADENVGKCALLKSSKGYKFFFKDFEDYALFKLWV